MKHKRHLKMLALMLSVCVVFTTGRLIAEKFWGITYNARTIEILIGVFLLLHLALPFALKKLKKGKLEEGGTPAGDGAHTAQRVSEN